MKTKKIFTLSFVLSFWLLNLFASKLTNNDQVKSEENNRDTKKIVAQDKNVCKIDKSKPQTNIDDALYISCNDFY